MNAFQLYRTMFVGALAAYAGCLVVLIQIYKNQILVRSEADLKRRKVHDDDSHITCMGTNADSMSATNQIEEGLKSVANSMSEIAQALAVANENFIKSNNRVYSGAEIYAELHKLGIGKDKMIAAARFLRSDNKADIFFACPDRLKHLWLHRNGF